MDNEEFDEFYRQQVEFEEGADDDIPDEAYVGDVEYRAERAAFERAGISRGDEILRTIIGASGNIPNRLAEINKRLYRIVASDQEKFKLLVSIYFEKYRQELGLTDGMFASLMEAVEEIPSVKTKNPIAYILGSYVVDSKRRDINKGRFVKLVSEVLPGVVEVKAPDVIRYARFWLRRL